MSPLTSLILAVVLVPQQSPPPADPLDSALAAMQSAVDRGRGDSAWIAASRRAGEPGATRIDILIAGALAVATQRPEESALLDDLVPTDSSDDDGVALEAMTWLAEVHRRAGRTREAEELWTRVARSASRLGDDSRYAGALTYLSGSVLRRGDPARASALLDSAEARIPRNDGLVRARAACQRASMLAFMSRPAAADSAAREGARLAERSRAPRDVGRCLAILGSAQAQRGDFFAAADTLALAAGALEATHDVRTLAAALQWRGYALNQLARMGEADAVLRRAVVLAEESQDRVTVAWASLNLGQVAMAFGDRGGADEAYSASLEAFEEIGDVWGHHSTLVLRADVRRDLGLVDAAEADARKVTSWARSVENADLEFGGWYQLVLAAEARGDLDLALARADTAVSVARGGGLAERLVATEYLRARILIGLGRPEEAVPLLEGYLAIVDTTVHARRYAARVRLAEARARLGATQQAGEGLEEALDDLEAWRASLDSRAFRRAVFAASADDPDPDLGVATIIGALASAGQGAWAFRLAERRRARDLADRLEVIAASAPQDAEGDPEEAVSGVPAMDAVFDRLDPESAMVTFVTGRGGEPTTAFLLHSRSVRAYALPPVDSLLAPVARANALLSSGAPVPDELVRALTSALVTPWLEELPAQVRRIVVVPDDILHLVPFGALQDEDGAPLLSKRAVAYVPSASVFTALRGRPPIRAATSIVALADPPIPASAAPGSLRSGTVFTPLPGARAEVATLRRRVEGVRSYLGAQATESVFKEPDTRAAAVVHVASHAVVDPRSPMNTYVLLAEGPGEDGRLTAGEIEGLQFQSDLVVLSACATATGSVLAGEGIEGLTAPLLAAGVRSIVASRWDVEDRATARLMADFYEALASGLAAADALNVAKTRALERGEPQSVWAAFSVFGDPLSSPPLRHRPSTARWLVILAGLLGAGVLMATRVSRQGSTWKVRISD